MIEKIDLNDSKNKAFADMVLLFARGAIQTLEKELKAEKDVEKDKECKDSEHLKEKFG